MNDLYKRFKRLAHFIFLVVGFKFPHRGWKVLNPLSFYTISIMWMQPYPFFQYIQTNKDSLRLIFECAATSVTIFHVGGKIFAYIVNRHAIVDMVELVENYRSTRSERFHEILANSMQYTFNWARLIYFIYLGAFFMLTIFPFVHPDPLKLPLAWGFPYIPVNETYWIIHYIYHFGLVLSSVHHVAAIDILTIYMVTHSYSRFDIMIKILSDIQRDIDEMEFDKAADRKISINMKNLYIEHMQSIQFLEKFNRNFAIMIFIQYLFNIFVCCLAMNVIAMTLVNGMYNYVLAVLFQQYMFCYFGNKLIVQNDNFITKIYEVQWHKLRLPHQKCIQLILKQSQRPVHMSGVFFVLDYGSFITLIRTSYSYFALLQNLKK